MANDLTGVNWHVDTAATLAVTGVQVKIHTLSYVAPAAAVGECVLTDGAGKKIATLRAAVSGSHVLPLLGKSFNGLIVASITASSVLNIVTE